MNGLSIVEIVIPVPPSSVARASSAAAATTTGGLLAVLISCRGRVKVPVVVAATDVAAAAEVVVVVETVVLSDVGRGRERENAVLVVHFGLARAVGGLDVGRGQVGVPALDDVAVVARLSCARRDQYRGKLSERESESQGANGK